MTNKKSFKLDIKNIDLLPGIFPKNNYEVIVRLVEGVTDKALKTGGTMSISLDANETDCRDISISYFPGERENEKRSNKKKVN